MTLIIAGVVLIVIALVMAWYGRGGDDAKVNAWHIDVSGKSWLIVLLAGCAMLTVQWWRDADHADVAVAPPPPTALEADEESFDYDRLSGLWDNCGLGDMQACDDLWTESPFDSDWEAYGGTCGERVEVSVEGACTTTTIETTPSGEEPSTTG